MRKTFGKLYYDNGRNEWVIPEAQPHVCIKIKNMFTGVDINRTVPFVFQNSPDTCFDLIWFCERYNMQISEADKNRLLSGKELYLKTQENIEEIFLPEYVSNNSFELKNPFIARNYQVRFADFQNIQKRSLLADEIGLGKTLSSILTMLAKEKLPALVVVQAHMVLQWAKEGVDKFTNLSYHSIKGTKPYSLPTADVYIISYSCLSSWVDIFSTGFIRSLIFDEIQELRRLESKKYGAAKAIAKSVEYCLGLSATPVINYGDEIFNILDIVKSGCLGNRDDFLREWCSGFGNHYKVKEPEALGAYLREKHLFIRRTRKDVGRELPPVNKIMYEVGYDSNEVKMAEEIATILAIKATTGNFIERGNAARELDIFLRKVTGVSKAREVANFCKILLDSNVPILLGGWHREVYSIWLEELKQYNPVMYTGSETLAQKNKAKEMFVNGETNLFIMSLRSGVGLDGLQDRCRDVVYGEFDWSPKVHDQFTGRVNRDKDNMDISVNEYYLYSNYGSDPLIIDILGLKAHQSAGIVDLFEIVNQKESDESRLIKLANSFLGTKSNKQKT